MERETKIEGKAEKGQKVVVVEDLISTGGRGRIMAVEVLRQAGCQSPWSRLYFYL